MKRWPHQFATLASVLILVAVLSAARLNEPEAIPLSVVSFAPIPPIPQPQEFGGVFAYSNGFGGTTLKLKDGKYVESFFTCTDEGIGSQGSYRFEGQSLLLTEEESNEVRTLYKVPNGLMELHSLNDSIVVRESVQTGYSDGSPVIDWRDSNRSNTISLKLNALRIQTALRLR